MLTFLRRIRKSLIESGSARKYMLYAIGEIALVVIGILIALQINNWKEWRKDRLEEIVVLSDLEQNLQRNIEVLESSIGEINIYNKSSNIFFDVLQRKLPYTDTLIEHFEYGRRNGFMRGLLTSDGYEAYKNTGFNIVQSKSIKNEVLSLFEVNYDEVEKYRLYLLQNATPDMEFVKEYFARGKPLNYNEFISSNEVLQTYVIADYTRNIYLEYLSSSLQETQRVLKLIKVELGKSE